MPALRDAVAVFLAAEVAVAAWLLATVFFVAAVGPAFLVPAPVRVDLTTVVPEDVFDAVVPLLTVRSCWRVAGRAGDFSDEGVALEAGRVVVFFACEGGLLSLDAVSLARARALSTIAATTVPGLIGLESLNGETGRDM